MVADGAAELLVDAGAADSLVDCEADSVVDCEADSVADVEADSVADVEADSVADSVADWLAAPLPGVRAALPSVARVLRLAAVTSYEVGGIWDTI